MRDDFKRLLDASAAETRRHFDVAAESIETKVQLVAESVLNLERKHDRLSDRMDRGFGVTQAMSSFPMDPRRSSEHIESSTPE